MEKQKKEGTKIQFLITYNNYTEEGERLLRLWLTEKCKYACLGRETGPLNGVPHLQGYMNLKVASRMSTLQKQLTRQNIRLSLIDRPNGEPIRGSPAKQRGYCSKQCGGDIWECGNIKEAGQGTRSDLKEVADKILRKRPISEIAIEHPVTYIRHFRGLRALAFETDFTPNERPMETVVYYGDSDTGKSTKAYNIASIYGPYFKVAQPTNGSLWFDGYNGEKSLIINDFKGWMTPTFLNELCDKFRMTLPSKGCTLNAKHEHVFITSNYPPEEWWSDKVVWHRQSLYRRITSMYEFRGADHVTSVITKIK